MGKQLAFDSQVGEGEGLSGSASESQDQTTIRLKRQSGTVLVQAPVLPVGSLELGVVQRCVGTIKLYKFLVVSAFNDLAFFHHQDEIGVPDRREPVGDDEARAVGP